MVAVGVLTVSPSAQAQVAPEPTIDKECTPNPVQIGEQITCTIDVVPAPGTTGTVSVMDTLPSSLTVTGANSEVILFRPNGEVLLTIPAGCSISGNTVVCPPSLFAVISDRVLVPFLQIFRVTIEATAEQCGTFTNTATASGLVNSSIPFTVEDTEEITVEGCEEEPLDPVLAPVPGQQQPNQQQEGSPAPITQEGEQESESGEIDQSFEVS